MISIDPSIKNKSFHSKDKQNKDGNVCMTSHCGVFGYIHLQCKQTGMQFVCYRATCHCQLYKNIKYNFAEVIAMTDKSLRCASVCVLLQKILRDQTELINFEARNTGLNIRCVCVSVLLPWLIGMQSHDSLHYTS